MRLVATGAVAAQTGYCTLRLLRLEEDTFALYFILSPSFGEKGCERSRATVSAPGQALSRVSDLK